MSDPNTNIPPDTSSSTTSPIEPNAADPTITDPSSGVSLQPDNSSPSGTSPEIPSQRPATGRENDTGNNNHHGSHSLQLDSSGRHKAIIIASAASGAVGLLLVFAVVYLVYRRRNKRRGRAQPLGSADPKPRPASAKGIRTGINSNLLYSSDEGKLEAGNRHSDAGSVDSETTDILVRTKSGAFSTPPHPPRLSVEKLDQPLVSQIDPLDAPRPSLASEPHSSLEAFPSLRTRKIDASTIRVSWKSAFNSEVVVAQGYETGAPSPGSPMVPLVTPVDSEWHMRLEMNVVPVSHRASILSLSRQSSKGSYGNDDGGASPSKKRVFTSVLSKKRRSRADSIDPFRKSAATIVAKRKARGESIGARNHAPHGKSRADSIAQPTTPGVRRKSQASSIALPMIPRRQSQSADIFVEGAPLIAQIPSLLRPPIFARAVTPGTEPIPRRPRMPATPQELPHVPRTPRSAARELPHPLQTPSSSVASVDHPRIPKASVPRSPTSLEDAHWEPPVPAPLPRALRN